MYYVHKYIIYLFSNNLFVEYTHRVNKIKRNFRVKRPNILFFNFIKKIEQKNLYKNCSSTDVFENVITDMIDDKPVYFPCSTHRQEII